jgi:hypothetical protein
MLILTTSKETSPSRRPSKLPRIFGSLSLDSIVLSDSMEVVGVVLVLWSESF